ncbi:tetratricopeptide repeat protein [Pontiella sulfatireligans]|uniref:Secretory immunoglobulin A-binding protein EsiB n=1 Tax=Pontiella sulfatireligans TaxID=2750658 RepID=A0A6C2US14_9BACT|nr:tetratricopeptide repeat protein [Pontiella sulfatireligans]VGO22041.1 Secretory immunoglobulin A-binding protein EsiB [Pontiella sulfatireligans]
MKYYSQAKSDRLLGIEWFRKAAQQGHAKANNLIGECYAHRLVGLPKNEKAAFHHFKLAAGKGDPKAMYNLGQAYYSGCATPKNHELALKWFRRGALAGNSWAQVYMTFFCNDLAVIFKWNEKAARQGNAAALRDMAMTYLYGRGVAKDKVKAYAFYSMMDKCWEDEAGIAFKEKMRLKQQLTSDQLLIAKSFAKKFSAGFAFNQ